MDKTLIPRIKEKAELTFLKPPLDLTCELIATDRDGNVTARRKFRSHSFVANFMAMLYTFANGNGTAGAAVTTGKDLAGTTRSFVYRQINLAGTSAQGSSPAAVSGTGATVAVGTGSTAPAFGDNAMGGFAGRTTASLGTPIYAATSKFTLTGTVSLATATTINEVGIEMPIFYDLGVQPVQTFLIIHDNVSGGFAVSAGGAITVVYTISVTT